ncbi:YdeI/OmpD-associated family protein [Kiloniella sp.]|uniref:YdeI/OmpD-associated family protein n=1 Tax=Kiloniella sp. TaxID=1938587 RepID=UPI003A9411DB
MSQKDIAAGVVHELPEDLKQALLADSKALDTWEDITPLARNEWICWIEDAKKPETRNKRISWGTSDLYKGKRHPCCWAGCPHRKKGE